MRSFPLLQCVLTSPDHVHAGVQGSFVPRLTPAAVQVGQGKVIRVTGIPKQGRTATVLLRGSNKLVLEEAERCALPTHC